MKLKLIMKRIFAITFAAALHPQGAFAQDGNIEPGNILDKRALSIPGKLLDSKRVQQEQTQESEAVVKVLGPEVQPPLNQEQKANRASVTSRKLQAPM